MAERRFPQLERPRPEVMSPVDKAAMFLLFSVPGTLLVPTHQSIVTSVFFDCQLWRNRAFVR
jgi:hypothetical protein